MVSQGGGTARLPPSLHSAHPFLSPLGESESCCVHRFTCVFGKSPEAQAFPELSREAGSPQQGTSGGNQSHWGPSPGSQTMGVELERVNTCTRTRGRFNAD